MEVTTDSSNAVIRPPIAWGLAFVAGVGVDWLHPMPFLPTSFPTAWLGGAIFALGFALAVWAIVTIRKAGTQVETYKPTTTIVASGPYSFTRNPIYIGMFLGTDWACHRIQQPVAPRNASAVLLGDPVRHRRPRGSLSGTQIQ